jgi:gliding motility-associated lipoprotein GldJ
MSNTLKLLAPVLAGLMVISSCSKRSEVTNWKYNDSKWGGYEKTDYKGQATGPNLVLVPGGTFVMGTTEQDVTFEFNNIPRRVTVSSFYIDETEISNTHYREYLYWLQRTFKAEFPQVYYDAIPDTLVWREELAYNDPYVLYYFRHPSYNDYPVVGVSWTQAKEFCKWRTDRVNEAMLADGKYIEVNVNAYGDDNFVTESYLVGQYQTGLLRGKRDYSPDAADPKAGRNIRMEDGVLLPDYRLPSEAEWEYAALGLVGNQIEDNEMVTDRRIYPWNGTTMRYPNPKQRWQQGMMMANFKRGRGDYAGIAGKLNDNAIVTAPVFSYLPNDFGLFNMAGNVNEWVQDVYRPMTFQDMEDMNSFRGNAFDTRILDEEGNVAEKDSLGRIRYRAVEDAEVVDRRNYKKGDVRNFVDGDSMSLAEYAYGKNSLINDRARVYKGGSWADEAFWLSPGSRRYLDEDQSTATLGFRCAMIRVGGDVANETPGGNHFKESKKIQKMNKKARKKSQVKG